MTKYTAVITMTVLLFFLSFFALPSIASAQEKAKAEDVKMTANVASPVSAEKSQVSLNANETLAAPDSHSILLTVQLFDNNSQPLPDRTVLANSDRGNVDIIEDFSKINFSYVRAADTLAMNRAQTDSSGQVNFRITSFIPGKSIISVLADSVALNSQVIQFDPLPFPAELTVSVGLPFSQKKFTVYQPTSQQLNLSPLQTESKKLVNLGIQLTLPFWFVLLVIIILVGSPLFIFLNFANLRKMRWMEREQTMLLKKMFPPNFNRQS